ncbi:hypothetical protein IKD57_00540 [Candidatus Saccharibacteria bacterium]|nr:hypothetical protein [Candidatus Saccharibacteria bacterium]
MAVADGGSAEVEIKFGINPTLTATLSSNDIYIHDITPGAFRSSNTVTLNIESNNLSGYVVSAYTGGNTSDLTQSGVSSKFTSIAANANQDILTTDNTWGYSLKIATSAGNGTSADKVIDPGAWSSYNGLTTTSSPIFSTDSPVVADVNFRIAAKASDSIDPGEYTGTINFAIVANPNPITFDEAFGSVTGLTKLNGYYKLQDMSTAICSMVVGDGKEDPTTQLIDARDETVYNVGKLADNRCWLLDNLALDLTNSNVQSTMDSTNTNATDTSLGYLFGTTSPRDPATDANGKYATAAVANWASSYSYSAPLMNISNKDYIYTGSNGGGLDNIGQWKAGGYYNYCAASAGSYCYGSGTSQGTSYNNPNSAIDADEDICPSNWRMPTGGAINTSTTGTNAGAGEYQSLAKAVTGNTSSFSGNPAYTNFRNAGHFPLSGLFYSGSVYGRGSRGYFWSSTRLSNSNMHNLYMSTSGISPQDYDYRYGLSVRCVAK